MGFGLSNTHKKKSPLYQPKKRKPVFKHSCFCVGNGGGYGGGACPIFLTYYSNNIRCKVLKVLLKFVNLAIKTTTKTFWIFKDQIDGIFMK